MTKSIQELVPAFIRGLKPYVPGKPIEEVERELGIRAVKLASNENPLGPSPLAMEAVRKYLCEAHRYPDGGGYYLRQKLAARHGVAMENIILGAGTTELIDVAARTLLYDGEEGLTCSGSFPMFYISVRGVGAQLVTVPLRDHSYDLDGLARAVTPRTKLIYLANPNNPTGTCFMADELEAFMARLPEGVIVMLDEAYYEYADRPGYSRSIDAVCQGKNLFVLRTFSKVYGLAGLRVGYGIGSAALLEEMNKIRGPFNTSGLAQAAALAALDDVEHVRKSVEANRAGLEQITRGLATLGVRCVPSYANFIFVELGREARAISDALLKLGVIVRPMTWFGFANAIRVSIGTAEENELFLKALAQALPRAEAAR